MNDFCEQAFAERCPPVLWLDAQKYFEHAEEASWYE